MKRPTIKDIARLAGVTPATVSMALNSNGRISTRTRERIIEIARNLDYGPNPLARGLVAQKTNLIGVVLIEVAVSFFKDILRGLEDFLQPHGYGLILNVTGGDPKREEKFAGWTPGFGRGISPGATASISSGGAWSRRALTPGSFAASIQY